MSESIPYTELRKLAEEQYADWRKGQTAFNILCTYRPDLSEQIRATDYDPFYNDYRLDTFWAWVEENW